MAAAFVIGASGCSHDGQSAPANGEDDAGGEAGVAIMEDAGIGGERDAAVRDPASARDAGSDVANDAGAIAAPDVGSARRFRLATTGAQLLVEGPALGFQITPANVREDADVVAYHHEYYGIPWEAFEQGSAPPAEWSSLMERLAKAAEDAGRPVFLSINMLNGKRESLAARTVIENGAVKSQEDWAPRCFDFGSDPDAGAKRQAYLRYVAYMLKTFQPAYLNVAIEVNLYFQRCPSGVPGLISLINDVYDAVKLSAPETLVFPSFQLENLYGYGEESCPNAAQRTACFDAAYVQLAGIKRDRFAVSTYPMGAGFAKPTDLPLDWFTRAASRAAERVLVAETGWISTGLTVRTREGACMPWFAYTETDSAAYLARLLQAGEMDDLDLITWWSDRDLLVTEAMGDCPCAFDTTWCAVLDIFRGPPSLLGPDTQAFGELLLKAFGTMGLRHYDGTWKTEHKRLWQAAKMRPLLPGD
ncbi:MAG: hypothetical protein RL385_1412 [Pseudomonadota bacterium]|jgi:hypothetical protein